MRKLFVFILALIVIAASSVPCCPADGCADEVAQTSSGQVPLEKGTCSPFFSCAGCSGFVNVAKPIQIAGPATERTVHYEKTIAFNISSYSSSFFQPPRYQSFVAA